MSSAYPWVVSGPVFARRTYHLPPPLRHRRSGGLWSRYRIVNGVAGLHGLCRRDKLCSGLAATWYRLRPLDLRVSQPQLQKCSGSSCFHVNVQF